MAPWDHPTSPQHPFISLSFFLSLVSFWKLGYFCNVTAYNDTQPLTFIPTLLSASDGHISWFQPPLVPCLKSPPSLPWIRLLFRLSGGAPSTSVRRCWLSRTGRFPLLSSCVSPFCLLFSLPSASHCFASPFRFCLLGSPGLFPDFRSLLSLLHLPWDLKGS